jgi:hypothetical protein
MKNLKLLFLVFIFIISKANAQVGTGAFSIGINQVFDRANQLVQQFQNAGLVLEANAGSQVLAVIGDVQLKYENQLKSTAGVLSGQQQQLISGLNSVLDKMQNHILTNLTENIQQIANSLPFSKTLPQLTLFDGNIVSPSMTNIVLTLNGNFYDIANNGFDATIDVGKDSYKNTTKTTNTLTFNIPKDNQVQYQQFSINIPYRKSGVFKKKETATFLLSFIILPFNAGTYELIINRMVDQTNTIAKSCSNKIWDSSQDDIDQIQGCPVDGGWMINTESVKPNFIHAEGEWQNLGNVSTTTAAQWHFKTIHKTWGTSGKINVTLTYNESQTVKVPQTYSEGVAPIFWGDSPVLTYDPTITSWTLIYREFDGKVIQYITSNSDNPYFKANNIGNHIQINTVP